jgi:TRAP-type C4-dicarboxylate transport system permease small subunit
MLPRLTRFLDLALQIFTIALIVVLACVVLLGVAFRYSGNSLIWYDEVAAVLLAWITFSGAAFAVLRNAHLGFSGLLYSLPRGLRAVVFWTGEAIFFASLAAIGWAGWAILDIFGNETMTTLRFVPRSGVQAIIPVSAGLMLLGRALTLPERLSDLRAGLDPETREIQHEIARAEAELGEMRKDGTP